MAEDRFDAEELLMKKYVLAAAIAASALAGLSAQAAPLSSPSSAVEAQVTGTAVQVYHPSGGACRWGYHVYHVRAISGGWACAPDRQSRRSQRRWGSYRR